jgi:hypothetical protein
VNEALVLLVLVWAAMLVPSALRSRNTSPHATVGGFERAMEVLRSDTSRGSGLGREVFVPRDAGRIVERPERSTASPPPPVKAQSEDPVIARRRSWFLRLLGASLATVVIAVVVGGWLWVPAIGALAVTGGYVATLRRLKVQSDAARRVVRELDLREVAQEDRELEAAVGAEAGWSSSTVRLRRWED